MSQIHWEMSLLSYLTSTNVKKYFGISFLRVKCTEAYSNRAYGAQIIKDNIKLLEIIK